MPITPRATPTAKPLVVLVEDDTFLAGMYVTKLSLEGITVKLATDGQTGLKLIMDERPNLVLLDLVLPKLHGLEVLKGIRADAKLKATPVLVITNLGDRETVEKALDLGATDYIIKAHFLPSEVVAKVKRHLA